jgi:hypothetical protein
MPLTDFLGKARESARQKAAELTDKFVDSDFGKEIGAAKIVAGAKTSVAKIRAAANTAKEQVYRGVGSFEQQYAQKQGIGGSVRKTIKRGKLLARGLKFLSNPAVKRGKKYYEFLHNYNQSFIETFTTEGKYDELKLKDAILHKAAVAEVYGQQAAEKLMELSRRSAGAVYEDYRGWAPTLDELQDEYAGIGTKCSRFIFKQDLEACLRFYSQAFQQLPREDSTLSLSILQDIKTNAITNKDRLLKLYMPNGNAGENQEKIEVASRYLND